MGALDGKVIAITGAGRGIGRAVAEFCASEGAAVVVNDYGVSIDGNEPTSDVADEVVAAIVAAGGRAVANASSVTDMDGGASIIQSAIDNFGRIDGVVAVAGILRERMFFNMAENEWDPVIETHLKGTFTVFRAAAPHFKAQGSGAFVAFTSGAYAGSVAAGMYKYGVRANVIAPVAKSRMSGNVPFGIEMGEPEDVAPMVGFLLSDASASVTGQVYTANGGKIAVWNQPLEVREMRKDGRWTIDEIAARFDEVGQEELGLIKVLAEREAAAKLAKETGSTPNQ